MAEARESPARSAFPRLSRERRRPSAFRSWFRSSWPTIVMLAFIFIVALFVRVYFGYADAVDNGYLVSGGSDSYYWQRIVDYSAETGLQLYWDPMTNYPEGIRNPRPPVFSMSIVVPAVAFEGMFDSLDDALGYILLWNTAFWGALTIIPTYLLGKEAFGRRVGIVGAFLLAIMPAHVQRSVFSNADHDSMILFLIVLTFYLFMRAVKTQEHKRWVQSWRSPASVRSGLVDYFRQSRTPVLYALMAGVAFGTVVMTWVGFGYVAVLLLAYYVVQVLLNRFKNADSTSVTVLIFLTLGFGYLLSFPVYYEQSLIPVRFDVPVYLFLGALVFGLMFVVSRDYPWTLALPAVFGVLAVAVVAVTAVNPALGEAILSGQGYFVKSKLYSTIAEARAPRFSELALSFGMVTFFLSMVGLIWAAMKIPKKATAEYIFMVAWLAAAMFMAISAGRFMFNAAPAFAVAAAWVLVMIIDALDFNSVRRSLTSASGSFLRIFRKSVKIRHVVGALFLVFMIVLPNVWHSFDAGIPQEVKPSYDKEIYNTFPSFMRPSGYDEINGSNWYLGAFGYSLPMPSQYFPAAWEWFSQQDADVYPAEDRPAYVAWWDYGFECLQEGKHPTVADNFQFGYQLAGNVIMAQSEEDAIALFSYRLIQAGLGKGGELREDILSLLDGHGVSSGRMLWIYSGPGQELVDEVLSDPSKYGPMASDLSDVNARIVAARTELAGMGSDGLVGLYGALCALTGWEIRYFMVDARMFPTSGYQTGIFYAPAKLSDRRMSDRANIPIDFFQIKAVADSGREYNLDEVTPELTIVEYKIAYQDMFYDSMFYRAMGGFSGSDVGLEDDGLIGYSGSLSREQAMPGWNMSHFRMVYRTAYFNPYPPSEVALHRDEWRAVSWDEAAELREKISAGEMEGSIDDGAYTLFTGGLTFLKYYHGAIVNGTLTTEEGYPVAGIRATVQDEYGIPHGTVLTDAEGHYSLLAPFGNVTVVLSDGSAASPNLQGANPITSMSFNVTDDQAMRVPQDLDRDGVYDYFITKDYVMRGTDVEGDIFWDVDDDGNFTADVDELIEGASVTAHELLSDTMFTLDASSGSFGEKLPPGLYNFLAQVSGWTLPISEKVKVSAGVKSTQNLAVKQGRLVGNVTYEDGSPAAEIDLRLTDMRADYVFMYTANETGYFEFEHLINSIYELTTDAPGYVISGQQIQVNTGQTAEGQVIAYPKSKLSYRITSGTSIAPYAAYMVSDVYNPIYSVSGLSDEYGRVNLDLPESRYTLYATYATGAGYYAGMVSVDTFAGEVATGVLQLKEAYNITGVLNSPTGVSVRNEYVFFESENGVRVQAKTSSLGSFDLRLPLGTYEVTSVSQLYNGRYAQRLVVTDSDQVGMQLRMEQAVVISGVLYLDLDSSGSQSEDEVAKLAKIKVTDSSGFLHTKMAAVNGEFMLVIPMAEQVTITLADDGYSSWSETLSFDANKGGVVLLAEPDDVVVSGRLSYDDRGLWGITVSFVPKVAGLATVQVTTGPDGVYSVSLPPSMYSVEVDQLITDVGGEKYQFESDLSVPPSAAVQTLDIPVVKRVSVYGQLLNADSGYSIEFSGPENVSIDLSGPTYSIYLVPGTYTVYATGSLSSVLRAGLLSTELLSGPTELMIPLESAFEVSGRVTAESIRITSAATIGVTSATGYTIEMKSGTFGDYSITLPPGDYRLSYLWENTMTEGTQKLFVEYYGEEEATVASSDVGLDADLQLRMDNVTLSGRLTDLYGSPIGGTVQLVPNTVFGKGTTFYVGSSGLYSESVQPGDYTIYVTRSQDGKAYLSTLSMQRNHPLTKDIVLAPGRHLSGRVTVAEEGSSVGLSVANASAKLAVQTGPSGLFEILLPQGSYVLAGSESRVENGITVAYGLSRDVVVGATDVYLELSMDRDTRRSVSAYWNKSLMQTVELGQTVTYVFTVTNTGNIADTFLLTFPGTGYEVLLSPSTLHLDFGVDNVAYVTAQITVGNTTPAGEQLVQPLVRSRTLSSARANIMLYVDVAPSRSVDVASLDESKPVSGLVTYTKFEVENTGNTADSYTVEISNLPVLAELGWTAKIVDSETLKALSEVAVDAFSSEELYVEFTATRSGANPEAQASVLASSTNESGIGSYGLVAVMLPDLTLGPGDVTVERDDISYEYDMSDIYLDIVLVAVLVGLVVSFVLIRRKKGLGRSGGEKK